MGSPPARPRDPEIGWMHVCVYVCVYDKQQKGSYCRLSLSFCVPSSPLTQLRKCCHDLLVEFTVPVPNCNANIPHNLQLDMFIDILSNLCLQVHVGTSHQEQRVVGYLTCTHLHAIEGTMMQWYETFLTPSSFYRAKFYFVISISMSLFARGTNIFIFVSEWGDPNDTFSFLYVAVQYVQSTT